MKTYAKKLVAHPLFSGSAVMIIGSNFANFISFAYHFIVGRLLAPEAYGELGALLSLMGLFVVTLQFLGLVIVKFVSSADSSEISGIYSWFYKFGQKVALATGVLSLLSIPFIAQFLHINIATVFLIAPIFIISLLNFLYRSFLQGLMRFKEMVISSNLDMILRLLFGVILIFLGYSVFGAVLGFLLAALFNYILLRYYLRSYSLVKVKKLFTKHKEVIKYALPIFIVSSSSYALVSVDVILVKHFFDPTLAGTYTVLSTLGRIIFFASAPVSAVMFPLIAQKQAQNAPYKPVFKLSLLLVGLAITGLLFGYKFFPGLAIGVLYGFGRYLDAYPLLFISGVFIALFTFVSLISSYYLSLGRTYIAPLFPLALISQITGILLFHDSLISVILASIVAVGALLLILIVRLVYDREI